MLLLLACLPGPTTIEYREVDGLTLKSDIYLPRGAGPFPTVLVIHGGGFEKGDREDTPVLMWVEELQKRGFAAIAVDHRLMADYSEAPMFPGPVEDVKCLVRHLKAHAEEYQLDPEKIYALGGSTGAYLSLMLGVTADNPAFAPCEEVKGQSDSVAAVVDFYGPTQWDLIAAERGLLEGEQLYLGSKCTDPTEIDSLCLPASVIPYIKASLPPFFITHGSLDLLVPVAQSQLLQEQLEASGNSATLIELPDQKHDWIADFSDEAVVEVKDEVLEWLKQR
jgi:acetyl esterase/lipase